MLTYIDCGSGIAGDMLLGALIGLGLPVKELERTLQATFREKGWSLKVNHTERQFWPAWSVQVQGDRPYGSVDKMRACIRRAALPAPVKRNALDVITRLEKAEYQAHGHHHHTVILDPKGLGLLDTLVDVVGTAWGFWKLNIPDVVASALNTGRVAPATAGMLKEGNVPVYTTQSNLELATPTGVAILLQFAKEFKTMPEMRLEKTGYGAGTQDIPGRANVVALYQGIPARSNKHEQDSVVLLETVIDDMDPRLYPHVMELLLKAGALDTWWAPIGMKKGRPGLSFTVVCRPADETKLTDILFRETTTLGIRRLPVQRWVLPRKAGGLRKVSLLPNGQIKTQTEFETAKKLSYRRAVPLRKLLK